MKKIVVLFAAFSMLLSTLAACSSESTDSTDTAATDTETAETTAVVTERVYPKYEADFEGSAFNMLYFDAVENSGWSNIPCDIYVSNCQVKCNDLFKKTSSGVFQPKDLRGLRLRSKATLSA